MTVQSLTGIGTVADSHNVDLSWTASTSQDVVGYNIYRGNTSGGPYQKVNAGLDPNTVYTDPQVGAGTYYYVTTAVDSSNQESVYSNEAQALVPVRYSGAAGAGQGQTISRKVAMAASHSHGR